MSLYLYAPVIYPGTRELQTLLQAKRLVKHDGMHFVHKGVPLDFGPKDGIICWGAHAPAISKVPCLNASYEYPRILDVNLRGGAKLSRLGLNVYTMRDIGRRAWEASLSKDGANWYPTKTPANKLVAIPDLEGYGYPYHAFSDIYTTTIFNETVISGKRGDYVLPYHKALGLDFAEYHMANHHGDQYLLRVTTVPTLNDTERQLFATRILEWASKNGVENAG